MRFLAWLSSTLTDARQEVGDSKEAPVRGDGSKTVKKKKKRVENTGENLFA